MPSELDRRYDEVLAELTAPGGTLALGRDDQGRVIVTNFPGTLPGLLRAFCALHGDLEALVSGEERLSFADLDRLSERIAHSLAARGIRKGDRVGLAMRNSAAWVIAYMAALKAGAIVTLLNGWWEQGELAQALELTTPRLVIADAQRADRIAQTAFVGEVVTLPIELAVEQALTALLDDAPEASLPDIVPEDPATILFTSGSTGEAKGALSTHRAVTSAAYTYATGLMVMLGLLTREGRAPATKPRTLLSVPLFHVTGEVPVMLNSFVVGRCMVLMDKWDAGEALRLIEQERITYFVGVPTMSQELMTHPDRHNFDLSSLTDIAAGGAPRPVSHVERLQREFPTAQPGLGYGLTETNAVGCHNFWSNYAAKPGSTGRAHAPYVELAILGPGDRHLGPGEAGEVAIRTAANIAGYWNVPQASAALFTPDGYVRTGDIGYLDEDGYLYLIDRKKEIIIRGGENISAAEVEAACYACPSVGEVAVFAAPDERLGEVPVAVVHMRDGMAADSLGTFLDGRLAKFKIPERIFLSEAPLPRLGTGKIDRRALKAQYCR